MSDATFREKAKWYVGESKVSAMNSDPEEWVTEIERLYNDAHAGHADGHRWVRGELGRLRERAGGGVVSAPSEWARIKPLESMLTEIARQCWEDARFCDNREGAADMMWEGIGYGVLPMLDAARNDALEEAAKLCRSVYGDGGCDCSVEPCADPECMNNHERAIRALKVSP